MTLDIQEQACRDPRRQFEIVSRHQVTADYFDRALRAADSGAPKSYTRQQLQDVVEALPFREDDYVHFGTPDFSTDNSDLVVQRSRDLPAGAQPYSMTLMLGVLYLMQGARFDFYKARTEDGLCVIFRVLLIDATEICIDQSNAYP